MGSLIRFVRPDGALAPGYLARAERGDRAVIVVQEWWGLNAQIKRVADRLAGAGFSALVPDLYRGKVAEREAEAEHLAEHLAWPEAIEQDLAGAVAHFGGAPVALLGFCMGGALTLAALARGNPARAGVVFYGIPPRGEADPASIRAPLCLHFARRDDWCTPEAVDALERRLEEGGVPSALYRYDAQHAFFNDRRPEVYDAGAAALAWERSIHFLNQHLRTP
jgi:carboxymethylenebutenolidase